MDEVFNGGGEGSIASWHLEWVEANIVCMSVFVHEDRRTRKI
jgi:hypothetical protein